MARNAQEPERKPGPDDRPAAGRARPADAGRGAAFLASLARWLLGIFFRRVEVEGLERLPGRGPMVLVANHVNGLIDPALLVGYLPVFPRFLAKSTLWRNLLVRPFLELAAAIPVYRRQDKGVDTSRNTETFARCHEVLAEGGAIALFPEGRSHNEPSLLPLKTGVSRIVLEAESRFPGLGASIVPVGLTFDDRGRFRSRALVLVGEPLAVAESLGRYAEEPREAVEALTERVWEALAEVTLNYPSWEEQRLIERAAEIYERPGAEVPLSIDLGDRFAVRKAFLQGYGQLVERYPEEVHEVAEAVEDYDELLEIFRLRDAEVASKYPPTPVVRFLLASLWRLLLYLPLALLGIALTWLPYRLTGTLARRFGKTEDQQATYKLMASLLFYPAVWLGASLLLGLATCFWGAALALLLLAPLASWAALRFGERRGHLRRQVRAYFLLTSGSRRIAELRRLRGRVAAGVRRLIELYPAATGSGRGRPSSAGSQ